MKMKKIYVTLLFLIICGMSNQAALFHINKHHIAEAFNHNSGIKVGCEEIGFSLWFNPINPKNGACSIWPSLLTSSFITPLSSI